MSKKNACKYKEQIDCSLWNSAIRDYDDQAKRDDICSKCGWNEHATELRRRRVARCLAARRKRQVTENMNNTSEE